MQSNMYFTIGDANMVGLEIVNANANMYFAIANAKMVGLETVNAIKYVFRNWRYKYVRFGNC